MFIFAECHCKKSLRRPLSRTHKINRFKVTFWLTDLMEEIFAMRNEILKKRKFTKYGRKY